MVSADELDLDTDMPKPHLSMPIDRSFHDTDGLSLAFDENTPTQRSMEVPRGAVDDPRTARFSTSSFGSAKASRKYFDTPEAGKNGTYSISDRDHTPASMSEDELESMPWQEGQHEARYCLSHLNPPRLNNAGMRPRIYVMHCEGLLYRRPQFLFGLIEAMFQVKKIDRLPSTYLLTLMLNPL